MKTVTGLLDDYSDASAAVSALESAGVPSKDISIVSNNADNRHADTSNAAEGAGTGAGIGAAVGGAGGLLTGLGLMAIPGAVAGAVAGGTTGGIIGAMTSSGVSEDDAHVYAEGVRRGGSLVTAKVDDTLVPEAEAILKRSNWVDPAERRASYNEHGWTRFDDTLAPYKSGEVEEERSRYRSAAL